MGSITIKLKNDFCKILKPLSVISLITLASCVPEVSNDLRKKTDSSTSTSTTVKANHGKVLLDNPIALTKNANLSYGTNLNALTAQVFITSGSILESSSNCYGLNYCFEVRDTKESLVALQTTSGKWGHLVSTPEFLQVQTYYHLNKIMTQYFETLNLHFQTAFGAISEAQVTASVYDTALPASLIKANNQISFSKNILVAYANCDEADNSSYIQSQEALCFGYSGNNKELRWAHDPTIIYHEAGHYIQKQQLNLRNFSILEKTQLGNYYYTEAGALGEGLSDFFSYFINGRTHWGEWAAGYHSGSRPLSEADPLHIASLNTNEDHRLLYPQYITYDPNYKDSPVEDIHTSGMISSHYLVALSEDIAKKCSMPAKSAREIVMMNLNETFAELGDLTSVGTFSGQAGKVNMSATLSRDWIRVNNPINYRSFAQTMAKNLLNTIGNPLLSMCNGTSYSKDNIETLLDSYGLLLFKTYNQSRNIASASLTNTSVKPSNRKKSLLISKSNLKLDPKPNASSAFVIDDQVKIRNGITKLQQAGLIGSLSEITRSDLGFNNGNSKVSPGEVVAIALNLYNDSNSIMGGVQVLANDWNHAETYNDNYKGRPCLFNGAETPWPLPSEGASQSPNSTCNTPIVGTATKDFSPVCFMQKKIDNVTMWVSQEEFRTKSNIDSNFCLDKTNTKDCFIRAIKGADTSYYSKIDPKKNWGETMADPTSGEEYGLDWGNILLFEVSKHIPPGTIINCRLRARFTNCDDCFHDSTRKNSDNYDNDYLDSEYNGHRPFKIINLEIPITD